MVVETLSLVCDACGAESDFRRRSSEELHDESERRGWTYDAHANYCPACASRNRQGKEVVQ